MCIELPNTIEWTKPKIRLMLDSLKNLAGDRGGLVRGSVINGKKLYNFTKNNSHTFLKLYFKSSMYIHFFKKKLNEKVVNVLSIGHVILKIYEDNVNSILQFCNKFNISSVGWIKFMGKKVVEPETCCDYEYMVDCLNSECLQSIPKDDIISPVVLSFDIETYSSVNNSFPQANRKEDVVFQISGVVLNKKNTIDKYLLTLGEPNPNIVGEDVEIRIFETEVDLIQGYVELVSDVNPNVIIGYNIFGFDTQYLADRSTLLYIADCFAKQSMVLNQQSKLSPVNWSSSAYGDQKLTYLDTHGRIHIDLLPIIRRSYNLDNYKLQTVAQKFLNQSKDPLDHKDIFRCYELSTPDSLGICGKYNVQDSLLVLNLFEHLKLWVELVELAKTCNVPIIYTYTRGQQVRVFSQVCRECYKQNIIINKSDFIQTNKDYVGATVFEPVHGIHENVVSFDFCLTGDSLISMANGLSKRMDTLLPESLMFGCKNNKINIYQMRGKVHYKGEKTTVKIFLQDGTEIVSTPDHKFMLENGEWCEAKDLKDKYVVRYISYPEDVIGNDEIGWKLALDGITLDLESNRETTLAFVRILGYIQREKEDMYISFETLFDAIQFMNDIELIYGKRVAINYRISSTIIFYITIPLSVIKAIYSLSGTVFPLFLIQDNCPKCLVREFLGGLYGSNSTKILTNNILFRWVDKDIKNIQQAFDQLKFLHTYCGLDVTMTNYNGKISILVDTITKFSKKIGFRYCINKTYKLEIFASYIKMCYYKRESFSKEEYIHDLGADDFFSEKRCAVNKLRINLPVFRQKVIGVNLFKILPVYDIEVNDAHNFVANGVVVSNCSLYPATQIAYNISYDTLITDDSLPDSDCNIIEWDEHVNCDCDCSVTSDKIIKFCGTKRYKFRKDIVGILPTILKNLLEARAKTRKELALTNDISLKQILDKRQNAYKISSNSVYGSLGTNEGYLPFMPGAECTTAMGRKNILVASEFMKQTYGATILYGDSVTGDTPIIIRQNGLVNIKTIDNLCDTWKSYDTLFAGDSNRKEKQQGLVDIDVWSNEKWVKIKKVIRHKTNKKIYRVNTCRGCVDVTEDHSLLTASGRKITPNKCKIGTELMHSFPSDFESEYSNDYENLTESEAFIYGYFFAEPTKHKFKPGLKFRILDTLKYTSRFYNNDGHKIIPLFILNATIRIRQAFLDGYCFCSGNRGMYFDCKGKIGTQGLYYLIKSVGYKFIKVSTIKKYVYRLSLNNFDLRSSHSINKLIRIGVTNEQFVYDLETESGIFNAGIGEIQVHNTDSQYVTFPDIPVENLNEFCYKVQDEVSAIFPKPMKMAYEEKIMKYFLIFTKKRYIALEYPKNGKEGAVIKKGIILVRRDNCKIAREIFSEIIDVVFQGGKKHIIEMLIIDKLNNIYSSVYPYSWFKITKSVKDTSSYKIRELSDDPVKKEKRLKELGCDDELEYKMLALPPHVQLNEKLKLRGETTGNGSRIEYVIINIHKGDSWKKSSDKLFKKIEELNYFVKHKDVLKLDYQHYFEHFIYNPIAELLDVIGIDSKFLKTQLELRHQKKLICDDIIKLYTPKLIFI